tara:strand:+ start:531 stop:881 length:351 start_codon:yes stop_codon:yes gene_type:complete
MPRVYKHRPNRVRRVNTTARNPPPPAPKENKPQNIGIGQSFLSNMFQGFSFGTGSQLAREMFSKFGNNEPTPALEPIPLYNQSNECDILRKQLNECNQQYVHDCEYLSRYIESKCN